MSKIRVIAGTYGGRKLLAPEGTTTHPMGERIRNALFNSLGDKIKGATVLDAFAGSGSVGIEALSRGASHVTFIERDFAAYTTLKKNIEALDAADTTTVVKKDVAQWHSMADKQLFDFIFCDPPFDDQQLSTVSLLFQHLKPKALMILSQPGRGESLPVDGVVVVDNRSYGNAALTFYRKQEAE